MSEQLVLVGAPVAPSHDEIRARLKRAGLRDSSIRRYLGTARSWEQYCVDHDEHPADASTLSLVRWLDSRCRVSRSPESAIRIALASARFVQRSHLIDGTIEDAVPYTRAARVALEAYCKSATMGRSPQRRARPMRLDTLTHLVARVRSRIAPRRGVSWDEARLIATRDAALILTCWWGALRADDASRLTWQSISLEPQGVLITLDTSKTGPAQIACASVAHLGLCPRASLEELRGMCGERERVFSLSTGAHVARRLKDLFAQHGAQGYTSHSLRAGFASECASQGVPDRLVQMHARWSSAQQHSEYVRGGRIWVDTPTSRLVVPTLEASRESTAPLFP